MASPGEICVCGSYKVDKYLNRLRNDSLFLYICRFTYGVEMDMDNIFMHLSNTLPSCAVHTSFMQGKII